jgi:Kef-type K+ transport system membrane component KefB
VSPVRRPSRSLAPLSGGTLEGLLAPANPLRRGRPTPGSTATLPPALSTIWSMTPTTLSTFVIILAVVAASPILADVLGRWVRVPGVVLEIGLGVVIGPALGWAHVDGVIGFMSDLGLATLMFLAGLEIDLPRIKGRPMQRALTGYGLSVVLGLLLGVALAPADGARSGLIIGLAITTTALGTLLPILRDNGELNGEFGRHVLAGAVIGELGPVIAISVLLSSDRPARTMLVLAVFVLVVLVAARLAVRDRNQRLARLLETTLLTSGQLAVRLVVLFLGFMVWVAYELGLDTLLGAFAAGMVFRLFSSGASEREAELVEAKLQGLGFGFLVPVFFVTSGMKFDLDAITADLTLLLVAAGFLMLFFIIRGLPTALLHSGMPRRDRAALACYLATELPLVVVITTIGVTTGRLNTGKAAALVTAALMSVLVYPLLAARLRRTAPVPEIATAATDAP